MMFSFNGKSIFIYIRKLTQKLQVTNIPNKKPPCFARRLNQ
ncbi:hypothetical protein QY97_01093 [Bacillus thermotolerans]|nr:hypothetical protein QY97_01093 [Bacillus thermotolerans]